MKAENMEDENWYLYQGMRVLFSGEYQGGPRGYFLVRICGDQDMQSMIFLPPNAEVEPEKA